MTQRLDIYGNPVDWTPTGRRFVGRDGKLRAGMRKGDAVIWPYCKPHENCLACAEPRDHDHCPVVAVDDCPNCGALATTGVVDCPAYDAWAEARVRSYFLRASRASLATAAERETPHARATASSERSSDAASLISTCPRRRSFSGCVGPLSIRAYRGSSPSIVTSLSETHAESSHRPRPVSDGSSRRLGIVTPSTGTSQPQCRQRALSRLTATISPRARGLGGTRVRIERLADARLKARAALDICVDLAALRAESDVRAIIRAHVDPRDGLTLPHAAIEPVDRQCLSDPFCCPAHEWIVARDIPRARVDRRGEPTKRHFAYLRPRLQRHFAHVATAAAHADERERCDRRNVDLASQYDAMHAARDAYKRRAETAERECVALRLRALDSGGEDDA